MSRKRWLVSTALAGFLWAGLCGCHSGSREVTYNPFVENRGRPTLGKQVEGVPNGMMERIDRFDSRMENRLY